MLLFCHSRSLLLFFFISSFLVACQNADNEVQVDPNAQCSQDTRDQITSCLDQVEQDEGKLSSGPCSSSDWQCICTKQQGLVDCYSPCSGLQVVDMVNFNNGNCKGQHGVTIKAEGGDLTYSWSNLPFTSSDTTSPKVTSSPISSTSSTNPTPAANTMSNSTTTATLKPTSTNSTAVSSSSSSKGNNTTTAPSSNTSSKTKDSAAGLSVNCKILFGATAFASFFALILA